MSQRSKTPAELQELLAIYAKVDTICNTPPHSEAKVNMLLDVAQELEDAGMKYLNGEWRKVK